MFSQFDRLLLKQYKEEAYFSCGKDNWRGSPNECVVIFISKRSYQTGQEKQQPKGNLIEVKARTSMIMHVTISSIFPSLI